MANPLKRSNVLLATVIALCLYPATCRAEEHKVAAKTLTASDQFYQAIRNNNLATLKSLLANANVNTADSRGATPLMYAAAFGNAEQMALLLAAGADVKARNAFNATALIWASGDPVKSRMLIERGADVNVLTQQGQTPLMAAARRPGNAELVRLLLAKGADTKRSGDTTLVAAAQSADIQIMKLLVAAGADVNAVVARLGETAMHYAAGTGNAEAARLFLAKGAQVNVGLRPSKALRGGAMLDTGLGEQTPLMWAVPSGSPDAVRTILQAGANVNAQDVRGMSALMLAVASEAQDPAIVKLLLAAGADVHARNAHGETALDWASKYGNREVVSLLRAAGAKQGEAFHPPPAAEARKTSNVKEAVERSVALLERSSAEFFKQSGCIGCHHQDVTAFAVRAAQNAGLQVDEGAALQRRETTRLSLVTVQEPMLQGIVPDITVQANHLAGLWAASYPSDMSTDSAVASLIPSQYTDGHWQRNIGSIRSPLGDGAIVWTAQAVLALKRYGIPAREVEFRERIGRAREWLLKARPRSTYQHALQLLALSEAGAEKSKVEQIADALLAKQHPDGGWGGNLNLGSDAHSTGIALHALRESGFLDVSGAGHRRGVQFLLDTQHSDGSWYVRSRAAGFQPYFQSGFPFEHDQWISAAGTGWAAEALARSIAIPTRAAITH